MMLKLIRDKFTQDSTSGKLYVDGEFLCYTLEDTYREIRGFPVSHWKVFGETAIPKGKYEVKITYSPRYKRMMPLVIGVEGYSGIRIHSGNKPADTLGCILVGENRKRDWVGASRKAYKRLFNILENTTEKVELEIL